MPNGLCSHGFELRWNGLQTASLPGSLLNVLDMEPWLRLWDNVPWRSFLESRRPPASTQRRTIVDYVHSSHARPGESGHYRPGGFGLSSIINLPHPLQSPHNQPLRPHGGSLAPLWTGGMVARRWAQGPGPAAGNEAAHTDGMAFWRQEGSGKNGKRGRVAASCRLDRDEIHGIWCDETWFKSRREHRAGCMLEARAGDRIAQRHT